MMKRLIFSLFVLLLSTPVYAQNLTPVGIGDLPPASTLNSSDMFVVCQSPPCKAGTQLKSATFAKLPINATPPITYNPTTNTVGLAIDSTLSVVGGQLHVVSGSGLVVPNAPLINGNGSTLGTVSLGQQLVLTGSFPNQTISIIMPTGPMVTSNGTIFGSLNLGTNLSISGSFPNQTLNASGGGGGSGITQLTGPVTAGPGSGSQVSTITPTGVTPGSYTLASCTGASCTPAPSCWVVGATGQITSISLSGACGGGGVTGLTGNGVQLTGNGVNLTE